MTEKHQRTIIKTISFRIIASLLTIMIVFAFTKNTTISISVGIIEAISKMIFYYIHERFWNKISWGKLNV
ncbi:MAG: DUF2061 domain-containing protein [Candidatus Cloacimonetes bacterium]|nr:DUF2061 domain-containing protein [Candidatus Cloacimonadota bacterium]MBL7085854.1 DUF2061 domain-containing protein [Candidatus Cloacimonadota bacterium]